METQREHQMNPITYFNNFQVTANLSSSISLFILLIPSALLQPLGYFEANSRNFIISSVNILGMYPYVQKANIPLLFIYF